MLVKLPPARKRMTLVQAPNVSRRLALLNSKATGGMSKRRPVKKRMIWIPKPDAGWNCERAWLR
jgi:hypothetical protein